MNVPKLVQTLVVVGMLAQSRRRLVRDEECGEYAWRLWIVVWFRLVL